MTDCTSSASLSLVRAPPPAFRPLTINFYRFWKEVRDCYWRQAGRRASRLRGGPGLTLMRETMRRLTTDELDKRTRAALLCREFRDDLRRDLGGDVTRAQEALIETSAVNWLILQSIDAFILQQDTLVNKKTRSLIPVVVQRRVVADSLVMCLEKLGLERKAEKVEDLVQYLKAKE